jgi:hypothetical protein
MTKTIAVGFIFLSLSGAMKNLENALDNTTDYDLIYRRQMEFREQLNIYRTAMSKLRNQKRHGAVISIPERAFINKLKNIENNAKYLIERAIQVQRINITSL